MVCRPLDGKRRPLDADAVSVYDRQIVAWQTRVEAGRLRHAGEASRLPVDVVPRAGGQHLQAPVQTAMATRFGYDFSQVRIHSDRFAAEIVQKAGAAAMTVGRNVLLADPAIARNTLVLSHELAHVVQQQGGGSGEASVSAMEREAMAAQQAWAHGEPIPRPVVRSAPVAALQPSPPPQAVPALGRLRELAGRLLEVQLKADALQRMAGSDSNVALQVRMLQEHLDRLTTMVKSASERVSIDPGLVRTLEVGIDAGGIAADLTYLDRLGVAGGLSRVSRPGANQGLKWAWKAMRFMAADPSWPVTQRADADECIRLAEFHRDIVESALRHAAVMRAGVEAAQLADIAISGPQLIATGRAALKDLAASLREGGGGAGLLTAGGPGILVIVSGGRRLVLTAAQVQALAEAGLLTGKALVLYSLARGGEGGAAGAAPSPSGPHGERPPGSKSRYSSEDIAAEHKAETEKKVPEGQRALEETGVRARLLRKVEENHHLLVQQLRRWFKSRGVNIDEFTVRVSADEHRWIHNEYRWNDLWKEFRLRNPKASVEEIKAAMAEFQKRAGLEGLEIVPYPR